jgi:hypothetical protein
MSTIIGLIVGLALAAVGILTIRRWPALAEWWYATWAITCTALAAVNTAQQNWGWAAWLAFLAAANAWCWWNSRKKRKRKRAAALAGAKSRARRAALVAKLRATRRPRPVLKPVPDGQP